MSAFSEYLGIRQNVILVTGVILLVTNLLTILISTGLCYHIAVKTVTKSQEDIVNHMNHFHYSSKNDMEKVKDSIDDLMEMLQDSTNTTNIIVDELKKELNKSSEKVIKLIKPITLTSKNIENDITFNQAKVMDYIMKSVEEIRDRSHDVILDAVLEAKNEIVKNQDSMIISINDNKMMNFNTSNITQTRVMNNKKLIESVTDFINESLSKINNDQNIVRDEVVRTQHEINSSKLTLDIMNETMDRIIETKSEVQKINTVLNILKEENHNNMEVKEFITYLRRNIPPKNSALQVVKNISNMFLEKLEFSPVQINQTGTYYVPEIGNILLGTEKKTLR